MAELLVNGLEARAIRLTAAQSPGLSSAPNKTPQSVKTKTCYEKKRYELLPGYNFLGIRIK